MWTNWNGFSLFSRFLSKKKSKNSKSGVKSMKIIFQGFLQIQNKFGEIEFCCHQWDWKSFNVQKMFYLLRSEKPETSRKKLFHSCHSKFIRRQLNVKRNKKKIIMKSLWKPQNRFLKMFMRHFVKLLLLILWIRNIKNIIYVRLCRGFAMSCSPSEFWTRRNFKFFPSHRT